jgi:hypothetical protein
MNHSESKRCRAREPENSFWDCVRPDESPAGDRTKAAGIRVSGVEAVRLDALRSVVDWYPRNAFVSTNGVVPQSLEIVSDFTKVLALWLDGPPHSRGRQHHGYMP